jgi:hypothetical protein
MKISKKQKKKGPEITMKLTDNNLWKGEPNGETSVNNISGTLLQLPLQDHSKLRLQIGMN